MNQTLNAFQRILQFVSVDKLKNEPVLDTLNHSNDEDWPEALQTWWPSNEITTGYDALYSVIIEYLPLGANSGDKKGYKLLQVPVYLDVPEGGEGACLLPNLEVPITLNREYFCGEHHLSKPEVLLNGNNLELADFESLVRFGGQGDYFRSAKAYLLKATNSDSMADLKERLSAETNGQALSLKISLIKPSRNDAAFHLTNLYKGLDTDGEAAYESTALKTLIDNYDLTKSNRSIDLKTIDDHYNNNLFPFYKEKPSMEGILLGHMDEKTKAEKPLSIKEGRTLRPLDNTQRTAAQLSTRLNYDFGGQGNLLAVNGPPGSGKTSMLKAVVAHQVVDSAIAGGDCPIIVAAGQTNQSVKNVMSAFPDVIQGGHSGQLLDVYKRWLPYNKNYGSYFASSSAIDDMSQDELDSIPILERSNGKEPFVFKWPLVSSELNDINRLDELTEYYLKQARNFFISKDWKVEGTLQLNHCVKVLQKILADYKNRLINTATEIQSYIHTKTVSLDNLINTDDGSRQYCKEYYEFVDDFEAIYERNCEKAYSTVCRERIRDEGIQPSEYKDTLRTYALDLLVERYLDYQYRAPMFHIAARYWEGRYLMDMRDNMRFAHTRTNIIDDLRRICMLSPVIISTFNKLPALLQCRAYEQGEKQLSYAYGAIDLLITDESGQATIAAALPCTALARNVMSVGDVKQLQPVITESDALLFDEYLILKQMGIETSEIRRRQKINTLQNSGSFLHLIRHASTYNTTESGVLLRGHYRCYQNIIDYCNQVVYDNQLFYIPPLNKEEKWLPAMNYVATTTPSSAGAKGSKQNRGEAEAIARLIVERYAKWQVELKDKKSEVLPTLSDMLAIITPFNGQPKVLREMLYEVNAMKGSPIPAINDPNKGLVDEIELTTIDTIHKLQGAERPIVIYSGVQTKSDSAVLFFAKDPYLLNVAVSRAKVAFIAFLCPELYRVNDYNFLMNPNPPTDNSVEYLGWYMGQKDRASRLYPTQLAIVESHKKAATLSEMLGDKYLFVATDGAITNMGLEEDDAETAAIQMRPRYRFTDNLHRIIDVVRKEGPNVESILLATDDDNVGEAIAWHLSHAITSKFDYLAPKLKRVRLRAIEHNSVINAFKQASPFINEKQVVSELVREIADKWIGQRMTQRLRIDFNGEAIGMGRVKAFILNAIEQHENRQVRKANTTATIHINVNGKRLSADIPKNVKNYLLNLTPEQQKAVITFIGRTTEEHLSPPPPRSTFTVMGEAAAKLKLEPDVTMNALQALYEK